MQYSKDCFWTILTLSLPSGAEKDSVISEAFSYVDEFESKYSRFIPGNLLDTINTNKHFTLDPEISSLIRLSLKISQITQWYYDITLLPFLENLGYGIKDQHVAMNYGYKNIDLQGNKITLKNNVSIELGSCGKGYILDLLYNTLSKKYDDFVIDFGWDMRVSWIKKVFLEDPGDASKMLGSITLDNVSIACSAGNKRKIWEKHHLINPRNSDAPDDKIAVYITHKLWVFADSFATALFVTPLKLAINILEKTPGLEGLIIATDGKIYKSAGFDCNLTL